MQREVYSGHVTTLGVAVSGKKYYTEYTHLHHPPTSRLCLCVCLCGVTKTDGRIDGILRMSTGIQ